MEARHLRDALKELLRKEQAAMAEFLVALSEFDRRRGWEPLGHANLFAFLVADLRLSKSAAYFRRSAAELLQDFPKVIEPLREGRLCLSTIGELAKVLTEENEATVLPRFFGLSSREAQELVAELLPRPLPSTRMVVTRVPDRTVAADTESGIAASATAAPQLLALVVTAPSAPSTPTTRVDPNVVPLWRFPTSGIAFGGGAEQRGGTLLSSRDEIVPLTANVRRVHFNVDKQVVKKLKAARDGLSHTISGATMEQVLEVALDLLLEKQAKARGQVKRPRKTVAATPAEAVASLSTPTQSTPTQATAPATTAMPIPAEPPPHRRDGPRETIPAAVRRAVWARDGGCCSWPLDGGGRCGSTHRLELDHIVPWARFSGNAVDDLRLLCGDHNRLAARQAFGARCVERYHDRPRPKEQ